MEYLTLAKPHERTGMVVLQAESEVASINMLYGGAAAGKKVMTSSSSPGISLMQEGISYIAGAELPCLVVNVVRGGPGLGTIQPSQSDYFQATKGGGHGDYRLITLAPSSVQEMADFVEDAFNLAFKYRNPVMILTDGAIGQMMEKVKFKPQKKRDDASPEWATVGKPPDRKPNIITSLDLDPARHERHNIKLQKKYREIEQKEVRFETIHCDDAEYLFIAYGTSSRICLKSIQLARQEGIKVGLFRPISLWPFPYETIRSFTSQVKGMLSVEMSSGQMVEDVKLAVDGQIKVDHYGRMGGIIPTPEEIVTALKEKIIGG